MSVHDEGFIVFAEVFFTRNFYLYLSVSLSHSCSTRIKIVVDVLNINNHEFAQPFSGESGLENVFVIEFLINFKGLHGSNVYDVHEFWDFVHKDHWADTSE